DGLELGTLKYSSGEKNSSCHACNSTVIAASRNRSGGTLPDPWQAKPPAPPYLTRLRTVGPKSGPPSALIFKVISSPLITPSLMNLVGVPFISEGVIKGDEITL